MSGKDELESKRLKIRSDADRLNSRINELLNKFILTPELNDLMKEKAILFSRCGQLYGHEYENGVCKWCGHKEEWDEE